MPPMIIFVNYEDNLFLPAIWYWVGWGSWQTILRTSSIFIMSNLKDYFVQTIID